MKETMTSISDKISQRKRAVIEAVNNELKNIAQAEHSIHMSFEKFIVNTLASSAAYCFFTNKQCINTERTVDTLLTFF